MKIKVYFIKNNSNFYSLATLFSAIEGIKDVYPEIINLKHLYNLNIKNLPFDKTVFCLSLNTISFYYETDTIKDLIKNYKTENTIFVAGGPHPSSKPNDLLNMGIDSVIIGSGESALIDFLGFLKSNENLPKIYRKNYECLDKYPSFPFCSNLYKPIEITRGCPYGCYFCQTSYLFSKKPIHRSIENIKEHVEIAFNRGIKDFRFITPNALGYMSENGKPNLKALEKLLGTIKNIIKDNGRIFFGTFPSEVRPEYIDKEVMLILKDYVSNNRIHIGLQSGSESMLKKSHRGHTVRDVQKAIDVIIKTGFKVDIDIIFGMPYEKPQEMEETLNFIKAYSSFDDITFHVHYFIPLPGTPWGNLSPTPLPEEIKKELEYLIGKGKLWGAWKRQMEFFRLYETKKTFNNKKLVLKLTSC